MDMNNCIIVWCPEHVRNKKQKSIYTSITWFQTQRDSSFFNNKMIKIILENTGPISALVKQINLTLQYIQAFTNMKGTY
jgi:hypothetical protein